MIFGRDIHSSFTIIPKDFGDPSDLKISWRVTKFGTVIHAHQRMNPTDFGDPLTLSPAFVI